MNSSTQLTSKRLDMLVANHPATAACRGAVGEVIERLVTVFASGGKLLICGNGGSAADAEHIAGELMKGFMHPRTLDAATAARLGPTLAPKLQRGLPVLPLTGFSSFTTAWANDCDREFLYAQLVLTLGRPGDALLAISTSGNAVNVLHAADTARAQGLSVLALTGESGGKLKPKADICVCAPARETYRIQEYHLPIYHTVCLSLEERFFG
jgi:D-sedoheptulose 7-phosphate isomerase